MAFGTITVGTTATLIRSQNTDRNQIRLANTEDALIVYLGQDDSVTTANGFPLFENQSLVQTKDNGIWLGDIFGIVSAGTADVRFWVAEGS